MNRLLVVGLAVGCMGTSGVLFQGARRSSGPSAAEVQMANDAAFRDGLYLGKLARSAGRPMRPPVGRWSTAQDRVSFVHGYQQGYGQ
jgi:hypothetical protein